MRTFDKLELLNRLNTVESPKKSQRRTEGFICLLIRFMHSSFLPGDHLHVMLFEESAGKSLLSSFSLDVVSLIVSIQRILQWLWFLQIWSNTVVAQYLIGLRMLHLAAV